VLRLELVVTIKGGFVAIMHRLICRNGIG